MNNNLPVTPNLPTVPRLDDKTLERYLTTLTEGIRNAYGWLSRWPPGNGMNVCNVKDFGAKGNGIQDDLPAINMAIDSLGLSGGIVYFPPGTYLIGSTLYIGNAVPPYGSTRHNVTLCGAGMGMPTQAVLTYRACTTIKWGGAAGGTMIHSGGPVVGNQILDLVLDGNDTAAILYDSFRSFSERLSRVQGRRWKAGFAFKMRANSATIIEGGGAPTENVWEQVELLDPYECVSAPFSNGLSIGEGATGSVSECTWIRCNFMRQNHVDAEALRLHWCDHLAFYHCFMSKPTGAPVTGRAITIDPVGDGSWDPLNIDFFASPLWGGIYLDEAVKTYPRVQPYLSALRFWPYYTVDGQQLPPIGANSTILPTHLVGGVADDGVALGWSYGQRGSVASAASIEPPTRWFRVTGTTAVDTIVDRQNWAASVHDIYLCPTTGFSTTTAGNILEARALTAGRWYHLIFETLVGWQFVD